MKLAHCKQFLSRHAAPVALALAALLLLVQWPLAASPLHLASHASLRAPDGRLDLSMDLSAPPFAADPHCPRALVVTSERAGVGHRFLALLFALVLAHAAGAAVVIDADNWAAPRKDGPQPYLPDLLQLHLFANTTAAVTPWMDGGGRDVTTPWGVLKRGRYASVEEAAGAAAGKCGVIAEVPTGQRRCTDMSGAREYCMTSLSGALERARPYARFLFNRSPYATMPLAYDDACAVTAVAAGALLNNTAVHGNTDSESCHFVGSSADIARAFSGRPALNVAWHLRNDDIVLNNGGPDAMKQLIAALQDAAMSAGGGAGVPLRHHIISQHPFNDKDSNFGYLHAISGFAFRMLAELAVPSAFAHMTRAHVLIHTGSSFANAAAAAAPALQVFLFSKPKESESLDDIAYRTQHLNGSIIVQLNGTLAAHDAAALRQGLQAAWDADQGARKRGPPLAS